MRFTSCLISLSAAASFFGEKADDSCPPVQTVKEFDLDQYISARWYVHQQAVTQYLPKEQNFCVYAEYTKKKSFWGYSVAVHNHAQEADGTVHDSGNYICAYQTEPSTDPAKLAVAPCFLPKFAAGPYWVLEYDEAEGYALISGGQPTTETSAGCKNGDGKNNSGLWIFTRKAERDENLLMKVRELAKKQGFDLSVLNDVDQSKCSYSGSSVTI